MRRQQSQSVVFLTEILLSLMIFALCSSVCAGLFAWAHRINERSGALSEAIIAAQSGAEAFKKNDLPEDMAQILNGDAGHDSCTVYYNKNWAATESAGAAFIMRMAFRQDAGLRYVNIVMSDAQGNEIYRLDASAFQTGVGP